MLLEAFKMKIFHISIPLKTTEELDQVVEDQCTNIQNAAWYSTPAQHLTRWPDSCINIRKQIAEKRKLRKRWQNVRAPSDKGLIESFQKYFM